MDINVDKRTNINIIRYLRKQILSFVRITPYLFRAYHERNEQKLRYSYYSYSLRYVIIGREIIVDIMVSLRA